MTDKPSILNFAVYSGGRPAEAVNLAGAYVIGTDDVPLRAEIGFRGGLISCKKRAPGPAGLVMLWPMDGVGTTLTETVRVPERKSPYVLTLEMARARLLRIHQKVEEWGLLDHPEAQAALKKVDDARDILIKALQADTPAEASDLGHKALVAAVAASEELTRLHAALFVQRRKAGGNMPKRIFGCGISLDKTADGYRKALAAGFDFVTLPIAWRDIEPTEQNFNWKPLDAWIEWLSKNRLPIKGSALVSFTEAHVPDWLYIWEHDFETIRDLAFEHVKRVVARYASHIQVWDVVDGIHAQSAFTFSFEQLMELTRMATAAVKQAAPKCVSVVNIRGPWGEYYAANQRTIPPTLYADMIMQNNLNFDALGVQFAFGEGGLAARDLFQISSILDAFGKFGKPLHLSAVAVPSGGGAAGMGVAPAGGGGSGGSAASVDGGASAGSAGAFSAWRKGWTEESQALWLREFVQIALSRPFVDKISWQRLADGDAGGTPRAGLLRADLTPKPAMREMMKMKAEFAGA